MDRWRPSFLPGVTIGDNTTIGAGVSLRIPFPPTALLSEIHARDQETGIRRIQQRYGDQQNSSTDFMRPSRNGLNYPLPSGYSDRSKENWKKTAGCMFKAFREIGETGKWSAWMPDHRMWAASSIRFTEMSPYVPTFVSLKEKYRKTPEMVTAQLTELNVPRNDKNTFTSHVWTKWRVWRTQTHWYFWSLLIFFQVLPHGRSSTMEMPMPSLRLSDRVATTPSHEPPLRIAKMGKAASSVSSILPSVPISSRIFWASPFPCPVSKKCTTRCPTVVCTAQMPGEK